MSRAAPRDRAAPVAPALWTALPERAALDVAAAPCLSPVMGGVLAPLATALAMPPERLERMAWDSLCALAADAAERVQELIAEALEALPPAPRPLILALTREAATALAEPVARLAPLLTEADLRVLLRRPSVPETVAAAARRPGLGDALALAIIARADPAMLGLLLHNPSVAIRESALDALVANAAGHLAWHHGLVRHPALRPRTARLLEGMVAEHLLATLAGRPDLDPALAGALRQHVLGRLALGEEPQPALPPEAGFEGAALRGDREAMVRLLAEAAGLATVVVERAARLRSAKGLTSLCWQAGFSPRAAMLAQVALGQLAPESLLPSPAGGGWPLSPEEMRWQVELLSAEGA